MKKNKNLKMMFAGLITTTVLMFGFSEVPRQESVEAVYIGKIDSNSFEVNIYSEPTAVRLLEENKHLIDDLQTGDKVKMTFYMDENDQYVLVTLTK